MSLRFSLVSFDEGRPGPVGSIVLTPSEKIMVSVSPDRESTLVGSKRQLRGEVNLLVFSITGVTPCPSLGPRREGQWSRLIVSLVVV